jgi:hypothetical protein
LFGKITTNFLATENIFSLAESLIIIGLWIIPKIPKIPAKFGFE